MVLLEKMSVGARKRRDAYNRVPGVPFYRCEFGFYSLDAWKVQGMPQGADFEKLFLYDPPGDFGLGYLGWCEAQFCPAFEVKLIEDRGDTEIEQDFAGRHVLYFKGRRSGFMPEYVRHPVTERKSWEENVRWRLNPATPGRFDYLPEQMAKARVAAAEGKIITQGVIGGYMYLRSLIGPVDLLYKFHDEPELIHACMENWLKMADTVTAAHQRHVTLDQLFLSEDICFNKGPLISPDMMREFLLPYYQQYVANVRARQIDRTRTLHLQIDSDGFSDPVIPIYKEIGMDILSPFEVASGCDVVRTGAEHPDLRIKGGFDKRILAAGKDAIDREVDRILPAMRRRGGYIPTCDHGVPEEVAFEDYVHFRKRLLEFT